MRVREKIFLILKTVFLLAGERRDGKSLKTILFCDTHLFRIFRTNEYVERFPDLPLPKDFFRCCELSLKVFMGHLMAGLESTFAENCYSLRK